MGFRADIISRRVNRILINPKYSHMGDMISILAVKL